MSKENSNLPEINLADCTHIVFNTGCHYTAEGQIIAAIYHKDSDRIFCCDISRHISFIVDTDDLEEVNSYSIQRIAMRNYLNNTYRRADYCHSQAKGEQESNVLATCEDQAIAYRDNIRANKGNK